ncbi:MAG: glycosyltransferase N-terminal domain-containing protein [Ignavibacteria bacterium]
MRTFWFVIYNFLGVPALWLIFFIYSLFNSKVREGFKSRRDLFSKLDESLMHLYENPANINKKRVLIHSSSLGEYQQAIPLAEELVKKNYNVILSFFSPSGYNNSRVNDPNVIKTYLPFDSYSKEKKFLIKQIRI